jgi:exoribonuclease R
MRKHKSGKTIRAYPNRLPITKNSFFDACRNMNDELTVSICLLNLLAMKLGAGRVAAGALNPASREVKIHLDSSESSDPIDVEQKELRETNSLVEEFLLLANISVTTKIQETFPQTAVLRSAKGSPCFNISMS